MKKIVAYVGSRQGVKSKTYYFIKSILDKTVQKNDKIEYEIICANDINISHCIGCNKCFETAKCIQDVKDDMPILREKLINSDFVILGSPIYAHNVSGDFKTFIDRSSYWMHLMPLAGKGSMAITTTFSNGHKTGIDYMGKMLTHFGSKLIAKYNASTLYPEQLFNQQWFENTIEILSNEIIKTLNNGVETDNNLEQIFITLKETMNYYKKFNIHKGEWMYWEKNGYLDCDNFKDVLRLVQNNKYVEKN